MTDSVNVIIVNYNAGEWLKRCLDSLVGLSYIEKVFIVDNRSTDLSLDSIQTLLDKHSQYFQLIENTENLGFAAANNQILRDYESGTLTSDYVLLLNPDCEINSEVLPKLISELQQRPDYGMLGCVIHDEDGSLQKTCRRRFPTPKTALIQILQLSTLGLVKQEPVNLGANTPEHFIEAEAVSGAFMFVRSSAMREVGVLDEGYFMHCEDLDWCMRFHKAGWKIGFSPDVSVIHAKGISSQSRPLGVLWTLHRGMARFFDKFYKKEYPLYFRLLVKLGIYSSFILRATLSGLKIMIFQSKDKLTWRKRYR